MHLNFANPMLFQLIFFSQMFFVKDLCSGEVLAQGQNKDGVYKFIYRIEPIIKPQSLANVGTKPISRHCIKDSATPHPKQSIKLLVSHLQLVLVLGRHLYAILVLVIRVINFLLMTLVLLAINLWILFISMLWSFSCLIH